jgi:hypothetical protein
MLFLTLAIVLTLVGACHWYLNRQDWNGPT